MQNYQQFKKIILKDKQVKQDYDELELEYQLIEQVINLRNKLALSQTDLAEKLETTQSAIARFESGKINPTLKFLKKLAKSLNCQLNINLRMLAKN